MDRGAPSPPRTSRPVRTGSLGFVLAIAIFGRARHEMDGAAAAATTSGERGRRDVGSGRVRIAPDGRGHDARRSRDATTTAIRR